MSFAERNIAADLFSFLHCH